MTFARPQPRHLQAPVGSAKFFWALVFFTAILLKCANLAAAEDTDLRNLSDAQPFDFSVLKNHARALAHSEYQAPPTALPAPIAALTWDEMQQIRFRPSHALWNDERLNFRIRFFHLGLFNKTPVKMFEVVDGRSRQIEFDPALFDYGKSGVNPKELPSTLGFAGLQVAFHTDWQSDVAAFQGASYFRAVGELKQYGLSARALAVDCGLPSPEEFPIFVAFWLERPAADSNHLTLYGLLDSPSVTGAYRFVITPGEPLTMDVVAAVYPRISNKVWGIAPMTSMFLVGENDRRVSADFRPEIHDSDGLSMHAGSGEWIWRPLNNPPTLRVNSFQDDNPRGFGLVQRDRNFDHYQDDGVFYDRRPSLWVEPRQGPAGAGWGRGAVQLVEIPTEDETFDNIVAFWRPAGEPRRGEEWSFAYHLRWGTLPEPVERLATVQATRTGIGGVIGQPRRYFSRRFVVDFAGGDLAKIDRHAEVEAVITASRGEVEIVSARPLNAISGWRAMFDLKPTDDRMDPIDLRLYLRLNNQPLSETWLYQWNPPPASQRQAFVNKASE